MDEALFESLAKDYPDQQEFYEYSDEERAERMPDIDSAGDLRTLTRLHQVYVHCVQKDGIPYIGFLLGCTWEQEHASGILMHGTRTVEIRWAETAFTAWTAKKDRESKRSSDESAVPEISSWRASVQRRKQANQNASEAQQRSAAIAAIEKEVKGKPFLDENFFQDAGTQFSMVGPQITEEAINEVFPEYFPGKEDFVDFTCGTTVEAGLCKAALPTVGLTRIAYPALNSTSRALSVSAPCRWIRRSDYLRFQICLGTTPLWLAFMRRFRR